jgi:hypothetical protein
VTFSPALLDSYILPIHKADLVEAAAKRIYDMGKGCRRRVSNKTNHRHRRLLRARRQRPRCCRAPEQRDELAASEESSHVIPPAGRATA